MIGVALGVADAASDLIGVVVADLIGVAIGVAGARTGVVWVVVAEEQRCNIGFVVYSWF